MEYPSTMSPHQNMSSSQQMQPQFIKTKVAVTESATEEMARHILVPSTELGRNFHLKICAPANLGPDARPVEKRSLEFRS